MLFILFALTTGGAPSDAPAGSPIRIGFPREGFASFVNAKHPGNRIGYRFHEHVPLVWGDVPHDLDEPAIDPDMVTRLVEDFAARPGVAVYRRQVREKGWVPQDWTFHLVPVEDGVELLMDIGTHEQGLNQYYGIQQCFRLGGVTNAEWRRKIAETPAFSEYDLWAKSGDPAKTGSLTHVLRGGRWEALSACKKSVGARTPLGIRVDREQTGGNLASMPTIGPYQARALAPVDCGLFMRTDREGTWYCGIYWEGTSHVTDHHPADCLHAVVNIGNVPPHARRAVRGKIYWAQGTKADLLERWRRDFGPGR